MVDKIRQKRKDQEDVLHKQASDLRAARQEALQLRDEKDKYTVMAEVEVSKAKEREAELTARIRELEATVEKMNDGRQSEEDKSHLQDQDRIRELETWVALLGTEKSELLERQETLLDRYHAGKLVRSSAVPINSVLTLFFFTINSLILRRIFSSCRSKPLETRMSRRQLKKDMRLDG